MALSPEEEERLRKEAEGAQAPNFPPTWQPSKAGDNVFGKLLLIREALTKYGPRHIAELEQKDGTKIGVWLTHTILVRSWDEKKPQLGDIIYILYKGKSRTKDSRNEFHDYGLSVTHVENPQQAAETSTPTAIAPTPVPEATDYNVAEEALRQMFPEDLEVLLQIHQENGYVTVRPRQFLGSENFAKVASIVRAEGGDYVSAGKESHFRVPIDRLPISTPAPPTPSLPQPPTPTPATEKTKKKTAAKLPSVPADQIEVLKTFVSEVMSWYKTITPDDLQKLLAMKNFNFDIESVVSVCGLKKGADNKISLD
jgi:hypothetical protein